MNLKTLIALAGAAALGAAAMSSAVAAAEERESRRSDAVDVRFDELDKNHDGFLSRDEANGATELDTRFSELDANNDGKLSRDEYRIVGAGKTAILPGAPTAASGATRP
jgi:Ca2+-binding EF-hand superfamily protein